jgi:hypothetical protein
MLIGRLIVAFITFSSVNAYGAEYELKWDTGVWGGSSAYANGKDLWWGNDFGVSTLKGDWRIKDVRVYCSQWPNGRFDGFRIALFELVGSTPGNIIWPPGGTPRWVKPTGPRQKLWCAFGVNWALPRDNVRFLAAVEQFYNYPNCDPVSHDDAFQRGQGHSWIKLNGRWINYDKEHENIMLRVVVIEATAVTPISFGKVKAVYH